MHVTVLVHILYTHMFYRLSIYLVVFVQVLPGRAGGGSFRGEKAINQRKNLPIECAEGGCKIVARCHVMSSF